MKSRGRALSTNKAKKTHLKNFLTNCSLSSTRLTENEHHVTLRVDLRSIDRLCRHERTAEHGRTKRWSTLSRSQRGSQHLILAEVVDRLEEARKRRKLCSLHKIQPKIDNPRDDALQVVGLVVKRALKRVVHDTTDSSRLWLHSSRFDIRLVVRVLPLHSSRLNLTVVRSVTVTRKHFRRT